MPKITAYADIFRDWEGLIGACSKNADQLPVVEPLRKDLEAHLAELKELKIEQEDLIGRRKAMTQRLGVVLEDGRELARKIRGFVLGQLGTKNEQLSQFGVPPIRRRAVKAPAITPPKPPPVEGGVPQTPQTPQKTQTPDGPESA